MEMQFIDEGSVCLCCVGAVSHAARPLPRGDCLTVQRPGRAWRGSVHLVLRKGTYILQFK